MCESGEDPANQIEDKIAYVPETILNVVAKDLEKQHVPEDVRQAAMHEHGGD